MALLLEDPAPVALTRYWEAPGRDYQGPGCVPAGLRGGAIMGRRAAKPCLFVDIKMGGRTGTDWAQV
jgi:hypothetical protein